MEESLEMAPFCGKLKIVGVNDSGKCRVKLFSIHKDEIAALGTGTLINPLARLV